MVDEIALNKIEGPDEDGIDPNSDGNQVYHDAPPVHRQSST
jgi:hypothetical protein